MNLLLDVKFNALLKTRSAVAVHISFWFPSSFLYCKQSKPFTRIIGNLAEHQPSPIPIPRLPNSIAERIKHMQDG